MEHFILKTPPAVGNSYYIKSEEVSLSWYLSTLSMV